MNEVSHLYIDASFSPISGKAGWSATLIYKTASGLQKEVIFYSSLNEKFETNNCAEALAALKAIYIVLSAGLKFKRLNVHLDSLYAINFFYKHFQHLFYFCKYMQIPDRIRYTPGLVSFPIEETNMALIKALREKFQLAPFDIGVFHVRSHIKRHPIDIYNFHQSQNNQVDLYASLARKAGEAGNPIKLEVIRA